MFELHMKPNIIVNNVQDLPKRHSSIHRLVPSIYAFVGEPLKGLSRLSNEQHPDRAGGRDGQ